jgi:ankyrin repeat protein
MKSLPARPSLDSLRKQAKKLARDVASGDADAIARVRAHLPRVDLPFTQRNAQLVIAREYGFPGWQDLTAEVGKRLGNGLERVANQARRVIHDNDVERLKQLLAEYPALLSWQDDDDHGGLLGFATGAYGDAFAPNRERDFTRAECAELLIDAGAVVTPYVLNGILDSRARGLLQLFRRKNLLPKTLEFFAALGDRDAIRAMLDENGNDLAAVNHAFVRACNFEHEVVASLLLDRSIALDPAFGKQVDESVGHAAFTKFFIEHRPAHAKSVGLWKAFVMERIVRAIHDNDLTAFVSGLQRESWLLDESYVWFQKGLIETAALNGRKEFIVALLDLDPAILRQQSSPASQAIEFAATYAHADLIPILTRIWPLPDDLPHAAAIGNLARVKQWFDESGAPALGDLDDHYPYNDARARGHLHWEPPTQQQILDVAFAFAVINEHFDVADFLLAHGADINTNWNSHEPASILHHLVFAGSRASMQFLIDRGIDLTIKDYRWNSTARGWAFYGKNDPELAQWLGHAERQREQQA